MSADRGLALLVMIFGSLGAVAGLASWRLPGKPALARAATGLGVLALAFAVVAWALRWRAAGHLPLFGTWESALSLGVAVLAAPLLAPGRLRASLWPLAAGGAALLVAHAWSFDPAAYALTISERSAWMDLHAVVAWAAFAALLANAGLSAARLVRRAGAEALDGAIGRSLSWGFLLHSAMIATGSFYSFLLFGRTWGFDPVESLALATWLAYGTLLHLNLFAGWEGKRLARWCAGVFVLLVISYRCIAHFPPASTYHIFDMDRRLHLTGAESAEAP